MHCEIICVGTEILLGDIIDTNSQYISKRLNEIGLNLLYHTTTGDNPKRLKAAFEEAYERSDIVIATGGLGPTQDDLTKETAAEIMGLEMEVNDEWMKNLETIFKDRMTPNNLKQADIPKGAKMLYNKNGTAPGVLIENNEKTKAIILLPGPPREMIPMFDEYILPYLMEKSGKTFYSRYYKITNYGESALEHMLLDLVDKQSNPTIATYAKEDGILLRVTANAEKKEDADVLLQKYEDIIYQRVGDGIFATEDVSLSRVILNLLEERNLTLAVAESCTGIDNHTTCFLDFMTQYISFFLQNSKHAFGIRQVFCTPQ
jgi:nicotinamide-nucleotide amidase